MIRSLQRRLFCSSKNALNFPPIQGRQLLARSKVVFKYVNVEDKPDILSDKQWKEIEDRTQVPKGYTDGEVHMGSMRDQVIEVIFYPTKAHLQPNEDCRIAWACDNGKEVNTTAMTYKHSLDGKKSGFFLTNHTVSCEDYQEWMAHNIRQTVPALSKEAISSYFFAGVGGPDEKIAVLKDVKLCCWPFTNSVDWQADTFDSKKAKFRPAITVYPRNATMDPNDNTNKLIIVPYFGDFLGSLEEMGITQQDATDKLHCFKIDPDWFLPKGFVKEESWVFPHQCMSAMMPYDVLKLVENYPFGFNHLKNMIEKQEERIRIEKPTKIAKTDEEIENDARALQGVIKLSLTEEGRELVAQQLTYAWVEIIKNNPIDESLNLIEMINKCENSDMVLTTDDLKEMIIKKAHSKHFFNVNILSQLVEDEEND